MINVIKKFKETQGSTIIFNFIKKIITATNLRPTLLEESPVAEKVRIYSRSEHIISRSKISENALKVLYRLQKEGYDAYLVGGCVRDLLLGREPKDFDVVTNADPEQVRKVFRNCRIIGRRFRLAHVHFGHEVIEVATFRGVSETDSNKQMLDKEGRLLRDNVYGNIEEDVWRRDFTVNALYYNIKDFSVVDYVNGMDDHKAATLKLIGEPVVRFREDPVRMLRAVRFAVKLGFKIDSGCQQPIKDMAELLGSIPSARLYDEVLKLFLFGYALQTFEMLRQYALFQVLFPATEQCLASEENGFPRQLIIKALQNSDNRIAEGKSVTAYFLFASLLWEPVQQLAKEKLKQGLPEFMAYQDAANEILSRQVKITALPRHISLSIRDVWSLQPKFNTRVGSKPSRLITHPKFRAAYDFLLLRAETGGVDPELVDWWSKYQDASENEQRKMTAPPRKKSPAHSASRKRNSRKKTADSLTDSQNQ